MKRIIYITFFLLGISTIHLLAQDEVQDTTGLIQFSGLVLDGSGEEDLEPIPFVTVAVDGTSRGTYTNWEGFFSIVVAKGNAITFSAVGYQTVNFVIPDTLTDNRYSLVQLMSMDMINLPETVVFPWPSREHFKLEFLAMETDDAIVSNVSRTMSPEKMEALKRGLPYDGVESGSFYLRQQAKSYYHYGQIAPMNIFNPLAWRDFFKAWKNGDFKKKKDK